MNNVFKKRNRKAKWTLESEDKELRLTLAKLRKENDILRERLDQLKDDEIKALMANDGTTIAVIEAKIDRVKEKIQDNEERYKRINQYLETDSKTRKNRSDGKNNTAATIVKWVTGIGGLAIGTIGLAAAYQSDMEGSLVNKKTFEWFKQLPILRKLGGER